jgi:hypothetical protein
MTGSLPGCINFRAIGVSLAVWSTQSWVMQQPLCSSTGQIDPDGGTGVGGVRGIGCDATAAEQGTDLVEEATETRRRGKGFEPTHGTVPLLDASMILFQMVIQVAVRPVQHPIPKASQSRVPSGRFAAGTQALRTWPQ